LWPDMNSNIVLNVWVENKDKSNNQSGKKNQKHFEKDIPKNG